MKKSSFSEDKKYKLYRSVYDIIHPSISKKNISNYKIILDDDIKPIRVFYPEKITIDTSIIILIPSTIDLITNETNYEKICKDMAIKTNSIVLGIDYNSSENIKFSDMVNENYLAIKYLLTELKKEGKTDKDIIIMGDSFGANIVNDVIKKASEEKIIFNKVILFSLIVEKTDDIEKNKVNIIQLNKFKDFFNHHKDDKKTYKFPIEDTEYKNYPKMLIFVGAADPLYDKVSSYYKQLKEYKLDINLVKITFADHNILGNDDQDIKDEIYKNILEFLNS